MKNIRRKRRSIRQLALDLDVCSTTLTQWVKNGHLPKPEGKTGGKKYKEYSVEQYKELLTSLTKLLEEQEKAV